MLINILEVWSKNSKQEMISDINLFGDSQLSFQGTIVLSTQK